MITLTDLVARARAIAGDRTAVICGDTIFTWAQVDARIRRLAGVLRGLGVARGDRVAMLGGNSARYFEFYFAAPAAGGIAVPINTRLAPPEIAELLLDSGARILIVEPQFLEIISGIRSTLTQVEHFVVAGPQAPAGFKCLDSLPAVEADRADSGGDIDDVAMLIYTGGTTGRSKGVMLTHRALLSSTLQWTPGVDFSADEKLLIVAPMFHIIAATHCVATAVFNVSACILPRFDPILFFETVQRRRPNSTALVPTMIEMLVTHPEIGRFDLTSLKKISYGGSAIPARTMTRAFEALPGARFYQGYGQTETGPVTNLRPEHHAGDGSKLLSAGQPVPLTLFSIHDTEGRLLPPGETGEICVRSPSIASGYWQLPELSAETQRGGWHHTGDAGYLDEDGFLFVVDRVKDMIITGGENVYAAEVEKALYTHPAVAGCAVIGIPHERLVEQVHAIVRLNAGAKVDANEIIAHCRASLAGYKCPRSVEFREAPFPVNPSGKIVKRELRKEYAERNA